MAGAVRRFRWWWLRWHQPHREKRPRAALVAFARYATLVRNKLHQNATRCVAVLIPERPRKAAVAF